jgi:hypothetical protein
MPLIFPFPFFVSLLRSRRYILSSFASGSQPTSPCIRSLFGIHLYQDDCPRCSLHLCPQQPLTAQARCTLRCRLRRATPSREPIQAKSRAAFSANSFAQDWPHHRHNDIRKRVFHSGLVIFTPTQQLALAGNLPSPPSTPVSLGMLINRTARRQLHQS